MTEDDDKFLDELEAGLEDVTPGFDRWIHLWGDQVVYTKDPNDGVRTHSLVRDMGGGPKVLNHIASCSPYNIRRLIALARASH